MVASVQPEKSAAGGRIEAFDGLRGYAALTVAISHCLTAVALSAEERWLVADTPLAVFLRPAGAVQLFFVLSGYVLAFSLSRGGGLADVGVYYARRVFRIYLPYAAALGVAWLAAFQYPVTPPGQGLTRWIRNYAGIHVDAAALPGFLWLPSMAGGQLPVGWSLRVEVIFSLLLPLMLLLARRLHWALLVPLALAAVSWGNSLQTPRFALDFTLGIIVFLERERLAALVARIPKPVVPLCVAAAAMLFAFPGGLGPVSGSDLEVVAMGLGNAALLLFVAEVPWLGALFASRPMVFLGRVSYSLYLLHFTVLILLAPHLVGRQPTLLDGAILTVAVLAVSLVASEIFYRVVERPSIDIGHALSRRLRG